MVKETARRFSTNEELIATATPLDREFSVKKDYISIITSNDSTPDKVYLYYTTNFTKTYELEFG